MTQNLKPRVAKRGKSFWALLREYRALLLMLLPAFVYIVIFRYVPMAGIVIAFKNFNFAKGIWDSAWVGFNNFRFFFMTGRAARIIWNTVLYNVAFFVTGHLVALIVSIVLSEAQSVAFKKANQLAILLPHFISWVIASAICYNLLNAEYGAVNALLQRLGLKRVSFYTLPSFWPYFMTGLNIWKSSGYTSVLYLASITGIDGEIFEAARIDGANVWQKIRYITLPSLVPLIMTLMLLSVSSIFYGNFQMFYSIIGQNGMLYDATDVIDTVVFRSLLQSSSLGMSSALGLMQSVLGFVAIVLTNALIKRTAPESALF